MTYKMAFVVPRYEPGTAGGAEVHAAQLAARLAERGHKIEVFTTCAKDHHHWGNELKAGDEMVEGVRVHRFPTDPKEDLWLFLHLQRKMHLGLALTTEEEADWLENSVHSRGLYEALEKRAGDFEGIIFMPYLFGITYEGSRVAKNQFILIPCLHNEPFARLKMTQDLFERARFIFFNTQPERELAQTLYGLEPSKSKLVALGFDEPSDHDAEAFRRKYGLEGQPYFIFVGRWEKGKNVELLIKYFKKYLINTKRKVKLVLLGSGDLSIPEAFREDILPLGYIPLEDKLGGVAGAAALCQPSVNESLSIVIMEAWSLKTPILVHKNCAVTQYHCTQSGGGLYFSNYLEFEETLNFFLDHENVRKKMGEAGFGYVRENYSWEKVLDRFELAFEAYLKSQEEYGKNIFSNP